MRFLLEKVSPDMWKFPVLSGRKEYLGLGVADAKVGDQRPKDWALLWFFCVSFPAPGR